MADRHVTEWQDLLGRLNRLQYQTSSNSCWKINLTEDCSLLFQLMKRSFRCAGVVHGRMIHQVLELPIRSSEHLTTSISGLYLPRILFSRLWELNLFFQFDYFRHWIGESDPQLVCDCRRHHSNVTRVGTLDADGWNWSSLGTALLCTFLCVVS